MRTNHRTLHRFQPFTDTLEGRAAVSSLVPSILPTALSQIVGGRHRDGMLAKSNQAGTPLSRSKNENASSRAQSIGFQSIEGAGIAQMPENTRNNFTLAGRPVSSPLWSMSNGVGQGDNALATAQLDTAQILPASLTMLSAPSLPSTAAIHADIPKSQATTAEVTRSGISGTNISQIHQASGAKTSVAVQTDPAAQPGVIRPMTLMPSPQSKVGSTAYSLLNDSGGSGGSGGGVYTNINPYVFMSGGGTGGAGTGSITVPRPVSVGQGFGIDVTAPWGEFLSTVTVAGMTDISGYFSTNPAATAPESVVVTNNVQTNLLNLGTVAHTGFVVDADPRTYAIKVNATYLSGNSGETTISFTSVRPEGTLEVVSQGRTEVGLLNDGLYYRNTNPNDPNDTAGITVRAKTKPISYTANNATAYISGQFMIMRTVDVNLSYETVNNHRFVMKSPSTDRPSIDNGAPGGTASIGNPVANSTTYADAPENGGRSWTLPATINNSLVTNASYDDLDTPSQPIPAGINNLKSLSVGGPAGAPQTFVTYLMYRPSDDGVWVALAKVEWGWGGSANSTDGSELDPTSITRSPGGNGVATQDLSGDDAFPEWTGSTQTILTNSWQASP